MTGSSRTPQTRIIGDLGRGTTEASIVRVVSMVLLFIMHAVIARSIGATGYGVFSYALSAATLIAMGTAMGWPTAMVRIVSEYASNGQWRVLRFVVLRSHSATLLASLVGAGALVGVVMLVDMEPTTQQSLAFAAVLVPFVTVANLRRRTLQGLRRIVASAVPDDVILPGFVILLLLITGTKSTSVVMASYTGALAAITIGAGAYLWVTLPAEVRSMQSTPVTGVWSSLALPLFLGSLSQLVMNRTDLLVLGMFATMESVGLYGAAFRIALLITFPMTAVNTIAAPMIASCHGAGDRTGARHVARIASLWCLLGGSAAFGIIACFPARLLSIFGQEFTDGGTVLRILALGQLVNAATGIAGTALTMTGRQRLFATITVTAAAVNAALQFLVVPAFGALGAATVTALIVSSMNVVLFISASRALREA